MCLRLQFSLCSRCQNHTFVSVTVLEVIQRSSEFLARKGVDSPRLQVELLLAHVRGVPRLELYLAFDRAVTETELDALREMIKRRGNREPLQHIIGSTSFCGYEIAVNRQVLIPRPETEGLAEQAWRFLQEVARRKPEPPLALDVGTGSGCLAVALAKECPRSVIHALDISPAVLAVAQKNATRHQTTRQICFIAGDGFAPLRAAAQYDLIISNPPYIPRGQLAGLQPEVRDYEPWVALDGGEDGLAFYRRLAQEAPPFLAPAGRFMYELGDGQEAEVRRIVVQFGWQIESVLSDDRRQPRIIVACREV